MQGCLQTKGSGVVETEAAAEVSKADPEWEDVKDSAVAGEASTCLPAMKLLQMVKTKTRRAAVQILTMIFPDFSHF